jgi:glycine oxidase
LHPAIPVKPVKGQMLAFKHEAGALRGVVLGDGHYLIPRRDGTLLAGSTLEFTGFDKSTSDSARETLGAFAKRLMPSLASAPLIGHWSGLRPGSEGGVPVIGAFPGVSGLFVNAGHYRNGLVLAPAASRLVVDLMLDRAPSVDPAPYRVDERCRVSTLMGWC